MHTPGRMRWRSPSTNAENCPWTIVSTSTIPVGPVAMFCSPVSPVAGSQWRSPLKNKMPNRARTNAGADAPESMTTRKNARSSPLSGRSDAEEGAEQDREEQAERSCSSTVAGRYAAMSVATGRRVRSDICRSPWSSPSTYRTYWATTGLL